MTVFTFDDLAVHAYASGSVDAWMRLIDEAIDLGREYWVYRLWIIDERLSYRDQNAVRDQIPRDCIRNTGSWLNNQKWHYAIRDRAEGKVPA